jgi:hypothetical protein
MFVVFLEQLYCQFRGCQNISHVVIDIFWRDDTVSRGPLLSVFYIKVFARGFQAVAFVGQSKCEGTQVEKMAAKLVAFLWLTRLRTIGD